MSSVLDLTCDLIARPSITPMDAGCQQLIATRLAAAGFAIEHLRQGEVDNLWATHGQGEPVLVLLGHTDVVPPGPRQDWVSDPFTPEIRDGVLYGRGAADMKGSVAAFVVAAEAFVSAYPHHTGTLAVLLTSDEEGDAIDGVRHVAKLFAQRGQRIDWCITGEPSSTAVLGDLLRVGRRGSLTGTLSVRGVQGHVAYPDKARNPIHLAAPALAELTARRWDEGFETFPPTSLQVSNINPFFGEFAMGGAAIAHNGNLTNAAALRRELIERGSIFQSSSDSECIIHLMARSIQKNIPERMKDALRRVEGAFSVVAMTRTKLIGVRDPLGVRPLVIGRIGDGWALSSETCGLDIIGAEFVREVEPGEMVVIDEKGIESFQPFERRAARFCIFEHVYFSRPDSILGGRSVYETRRQIGVELAKEAPVDADLVCPVPDSGTPAAIGFSQQSGIPYAMGIIRNQYMGRTFIEPTEQIRNMGVRLKLNVNRALIKGKRVILVDDSVVRGTTSRKIKDMILDAGAAEVHFRIASPPTAWPCFYGVDTPERAKLLAANMSEDEMRDWIGVDSLRFISLDGLYRAVGEAAGRDPKAPRYCDACFSGDYPVAPSDKIEQGFEMKAAQ